MQVYDIRLIEEVINATYNRFTRDKEDGTLKTCGFVFGRAESRLRESDARFESIQKERIYDLEWAIVRSHSDMRRKWKLKETKGEWSAQNLLHMNGQYVDGVHLPTHEFIVNGTKDGVVVKTLTTAKELADHLYAEINGYKGTLPTNDDIFIFFYEADEPNHSGPLFDDVWVESFPNLIKRALNEPKENLTQ